MVSTLSLDIRPEDGRSVRVTLHALHRFGSFVNCLAAKNSCSPDVQMNSPPQSTHVRLLSWNSTGRHPFSFRSPAAYSVSRRIFFRFRFRASACLARRLSPGFR
jgi:hypothetical protein